MDEERREGPVKQKQTNLHVSRKRLKLHDVRRPADDSLRLLNRTL